MQRRSRPFALRHMTLSTVSLFCRTLQRDALIASAVLGLAFVACDAKNRSYGVTDPLGVDVSTPNSTASTSPSHSNVAVQCVSGTQGDEGCSCFPNSTCLVGLICIGSRCERAASEAGVNPIATGSSTSTASEPVGTDSASHMNDSGVLIDVDASMSDNDAGALSPTTSLSSTPDGTTSAMATAAPSSSPTPAPSMAPPVIEEPTLITSAVGNYWQEGEVTETDGTATVTVNESQTLQEWQGFGGTFSERGWDVLSELDTGDRDRALQLLFSKADGAALTWGRIPVGATEYAMDRYTLNDQANDYNMLQFSIERDEQMLIPFVQAAQTVQPELKFFATPWTPPPWMKDNNAYDRGNFKTDAQTMQAYALYLSRFVEEYAGVGIDILALAPQNEPGYAQDYPSCGWTAPQLTSFIADYLGPTFSSRDISTDIWLGALSASSDNTLGQAVLADETAFAFVKAIGLQWDMLEKVSDYATHGLPVFQTEHKAGNFPWMVDSYNASYAPNDHAYAVESWGYLKSWISSGVNGYFAWNMVLDKVGMTLDAVRQWNQNSLLTVDTATDTLTVTPAYYVFRHLSQYVEPGAVRVGTTGGDALAFKNPDGSIVTVLYNSSNQAAATKLSVAGKLLSFTVPASGWATVNWH